MNTPDNLTDPGERAALRDLRAAIQPRRSVVAAKKVKAKKTRARRKDTKSIRAEVMARADGVCECGCGCPFTSLLPAHWDHFFGRARAKQSAGNTWALRADCDRAKTINEPSTEWWLERFITHADKYGFDDEAAMAQRRLDSLRLQAEAAAVAK